MVGHNIGQRVDTLLANLIDELLEITVIGSFSHIGYDVRSRVFAWTAPAADSLAGRTILLTGATSGLGRDAANQLEKIQQGAVPAGAHCAALDGLEEENEHLRESLQTERNDKAAWTAAFANYQCGYNCEMNTGSESERKTCLRAQSRCEKQSLRLPASKQARRQ